jgi:hypothetical protein
MKLSNLSIAIILQSLAKLASTSPRFCDLLGDLGSGLVGQCYRRLKFRLVAQPIELAFALTYNQKVKDSKIKIHRKRTKE